MADMQTPMTPQEIQAALQALTQRVDGLEARAAKDRLCIGVMKGDLDYTMASFIIALGASAYDMEVDMFFTFWATAALRDPKKKVKKGLLDTMFGVMLPKGSRKLPLSKMQMLGIGPEMIRAVMKSRNVQSLEDLMAEAGKAGIRIHVCTMSMDVMGIKKEELVDYPGMDFVGVGTFVDMFSDAKQCFFL